MNGTGALIAVVDDEASMRTMLGRLLRLAEYRVTAFASGEDFLVALTDSLPACAILDVHMPGLSGFEVQAQLRAANIPVPAILITASDDVALDRSASESGAVCMLRKPFSNDTLLEAIRVALASSRDDT